MGLSLGWVGVFKFGGFVFFVFSFWFCGWVVVGFVGWWFLFIG